MTSLRGPVRLLFAVLVAMTFSSSAEAGLGCVTDNLRALLGRRTAGEGGVAPATPETVAGNRAAYQQLQSSMRTSVESAATRGRLKIVRITRGENGDITGHEILAPEIVPGRYYSAIRLDDGTVAIGEFDYRNGVHTAMGRAFGGRPREYTFPRGFACGGIIFYDTGAQVSGRCRGYPSSQNLRDLTRALRRMGIRVDSRRSTPDAIVESNPMIRREDIDDAPMRF